MVNNANYNILEQRRLLIDRIFNGANQVEYMTGDKGGDSNSWPALREFFNSTCALPSFEDICA
jgi:hypothetical protein